MYKISLNKYFDLLSWDSVFLAFEKGFLDMNTVMEYAYMFLEKTPDDKNVLDLLLTDDTSDENILFLMNKIIECADNQENQMRIIRFIILSEILDNQEDNDILSMLEKVYADFEYPKDMQGFIAYMPCDDEEYDSAEHTFEENKSRMINKFLDFMREESKWMACTHK